MGSEDRLTQVRKNKAMAAHSRIQAPFLEAGAGGTGGKGGMRKREWLWGKGADRTCGFFL